MGASGAKVECRCLGDIAVLVIDNPPVNATSMSIRSSLFERLREVNGNPAVRGVVLIGAGKSFISGADIREFGQVLPGPNGRTVIESIEAMSKPVIAALHGNALGGGLEIALAAHYRVAVPTVRVGLPEVNIGVIPGGGGTQRLPRIVGAEVALDLITSGKHVDGRSAHEMGIIDALVSGNDFDELLEGALAFARKVSASSQPLPRVRDRIAKAADRLVFAKYRSNNARKWNGLIAQWRSVDCIEAACTQPWEQAYAFEEKCFLECKASPQRAALSHLFFAEREAAKIPELPADVRPVPVRNVAVIGAGTMGSGIAMAFANSGIPVRQLDMSDEALRRGRATIEQNYAASVNRGSMSEASAASALDRIQSTLSYEDVADCDLVIEAVFEDMALKQEIFRQLDTTMKAGAVLATNTSTLDIDQLAAATRRPESVVGLHFFSPAHVMKLIECVRGARSSPQTLSTAMGVARQLNKVAVLAGNSDGFIGNRILAAYGREADFLLEEGALPWQVDAALQTFGLPMGLYLMRDMAGLDVSWRVRQYREQYRDKSLRYSTIADRICELGRFGQKTSAGYYSYQGRTASPDPVIESLILAVSKSLGIERRMITDAQIMDRILLSMVNEGARIIGEGHAARASDIDVTYANGYGFPRYHGGPMFWAERQGLANILARVRENERRAGRLWSPAPLLERAAVAGTWRAAEAALLR